MRPKSKLSHVGHFSRTHLCALSSTKKRVLFLRRSLLVAFLLSLVILPVRAQQALPSPPTPKRPVVDEYHGVKVTDDYRWLEDFSDPMVRSWADEQNRFSRALLDNIPARANIAKRLQEIYGDQSVTYYNFVQSRRLFALKSQPPQNQPLLVMLQAPDDRASERVILDLNVLNPKGTTAIDFYAPSLDGRFVVVSLSENGSEDGTAHVYETATGKALADIVPRVNYPTGLGSFAWNRDATGFYYTRYPQGNERPKEDLNFYQQVYFHKLGTPASADTYVIGREFPRIAEITLSTNEDGSYLLASVANGDGGEFAHYLRTPAGEWRQLTQFSDQVKSISFGLDGRLYLLSVKDAQRGKILALPLSNPNLADAKTLVPESDVTINYFVPAATRLYVDAMVGGPSEVRVFDLQGKQLTTIPTPPVSAVDVGVVLQGDEVLIGSMSYVEPFVWSRYNPATGKMTKTNLTSTPSVNFADAQVVREFATSKDGTRIPLNIIMRKGTRLDGQNPTILYGYGGYAISETPNFNRRNRV